MITKSNIVVISIILAFMLAFNLNANNLEIKNAIDHFNNNEFDVAKQIFEKNFKIHSKNDTIAYYLGRIYFIKNNIDKSIDWFEKAISNQENNSVYHHWLGRAVGSKAQNTSIFKQPFLAKRCKNEFEKAVELDPDNLDARFDLIEYYIQAPGMIGGSKEKAKIQAAYIKSKDEVLGHMALASVYAADDKTELAEKEYLLAIEKKPEDSSLYYSLGSFYHKINKDDNAFEIYNKMIESNIDKHFPYYQYARISALTGKNLEQGIKCMNQYIAEFSEGDNPPLEWAYYRLGMIYKKNMDKVNAKKQFEAALKIKSDFKEAKEALKKL